MPHEFADALAAVFDRLLTIAAEDPELKSRFQNLARSFVTEFQQQLTQVKAEQPATSNGVLTSPVIPPPPAVVVEPPRPSVPPAPSAPREKLPELTLGRARPPEPAAAPAYPEISAGENLKLVAERCRLKAEGTRWAAARKRKLAEGANFETDIEPLDRDIIARAKALPNCFLWMCHPSGPAPSDLSVYEMVAGCFEILSEAVSLVIEIQEETESEQVDFEAALDLAAEAQSALRVAILELDGPSDTDQNSVFHWLKSVASERQIFIRNYMRLDRPADPSRWRDVHNRIDEVSQRLQDSRQRKSQRKRLLGKVRHKASLIAQDPARGAAEWPALVETVCQLIRDGVPPSNRELRELLLPVVDALPELDEVPPELDRVLAEIDRYLAAYPQPEASTSVRTSPEVEEVASFLENKTVLLIGGEKRQGAYQSLKETFGLKELIWIETRAHESVASFEPYVARPDVVVVLLAIRWSSHSYGEVQAFCSRYDKPLVRLPGGYNANQVAAQILKQASLRLR